MLSGSPNISGAKESRVKSVEDFRQLLIRFDELNQSFLQSVQAFRERVEPGIVTRALNVFNPPKGASTRSTSSTPLLSLKKTATQETDKESLSKLNVLLESGHREENLRYAVIACNKFVKWMTQESQARGIINHQLVQLGLQTRSEFQEDVRNRQVSVNTAKEKAVQLYYELQDLSANFSVLKAVEGPLASTYARLESEVISFGEQALELHRRNQDKEKLKQLVRHVPPLDLLAQVPKEAVKFSDLDGRIIQNRLGDQWQKVWGSGDLYKDDMAVFQHKFPGLSQTLGLKLSELQQQAHACESVRWEDLQAELQAINAKMKKEPQFYDGSDEFRKKLIRLIKPLLHEKKIFTAEEKQQQINSVEDAFDSTINEVSAQLLAMQKTIAEIDALNDRSPPVLEPVTVASSIEEGIKMLNSLRGIYWNRVDHLTIVPKWAQYYSDQHAILLLDRFRNIVTQEDYEAICKQAGVSIDHDLDALIKRHRDKIFIFEDVQEVVFEKFLASAEFKEYDTFEKLDNLRMFGEDFVFAFCADGAESARKILSVGIEFLKMTNKASLSQMRNQDEVNKEAERLVSESKAHVALKQAKELYQASHVAKQAADKYSPERVSQVLEEQQTLVVSETAKLKNKWLVQPEWNKKLTDGLGLYVNSKPIERLHELQQTVTEIGRFFGVLMRAFNSTVISETGSHAYNNIAVQFNEIKTLMQDIYLATTYLLEDDASMLKTFMNAFEVHVNNNIEALREILLDEFQAACAGMTADIEEVVRRQVKLDKKHHEVSALATVLPAFELQKRGFKELQEKFKKRMDIVLLHKLAIGEPLFAVNESAGNASLSMFDIDSAWLNTHVRPFVAGDFYLFGREEEKRQQRAKEALVWAEDFKPNAALLSDLKELSGKVCQAKKMSPVSLHNKRVTNFSSVLKSVHLDLTEKVIATEEKLKLFQSLKDNMMPWLVEELDQANPYSRTMVSQMVNDELRPHWGIWQEVYFLDVHRSVERDNKERSDHASRLFNELTAQSEALKLILNEHKRFIHSSENQLLSIESTVLRFVVNMRMYADQVGKNQLSINDILNEKKQLFVKEVTQVLHPIIDIRKQANDTERMLRASYQVDLNEMILIAEKQSKLQRSFGSILADIEMTPATVASAAVECEAISAEINKQLGIIQNRVPLSANVESYSIPSVDMPVFNVAIINAIKAIIEDEGEEKKKLPLDLLISRKDVLDRAKAVIDQSVRIYESLRVSRESNVTICELFKSEKTRMQREQQALIDHLYQQAALLLSKKTTSKLVSEASEKKDKFVILAASRLEQVKHSFSNVRNSSAELERAQHGLLTRYNNVCDAQLKKLSVLFGQAFELLKNGSNKIEEVWITHLNEFDLAVKRSLKPGSQEGTFHILKNEVMPNFDVIINAESIKDFVVFPIGKEGNYAKLSEVLSKILSNVHLMLKDYQGFFSDYHSSIIYPFEAKQRNNEPKLWEIYHTEMQQMTELYRWLMDASENVKSYGPLVGEVNSAINPDEMAKLANWIEDRITPFLSEYKQLTVCEKQIATLEEVIIKLDDEQLVIDGVLDKLSALRSQSAAIQSELDSLMRLEACIAKRIEQITEFKLSKRAFDEGKQALFACDESSFNKINGPIFKRLSYVFLSNAESKEILAKLLERANKHAKEANKTAIKMFVDRLINCTTNLFDFVDLVQKPLKEGILGEGEFGISLKATRGEPTQTCMLMQRLDDVIKKLINNAAETLVYDDLEAQFVAQQARLCNQDALYAYALGEEKSIAYIFDFHSNRIEQALSDVKTKHVANLMGIQKKLEVIRENSDDEQDKLKSLHTLIHDEYVIVSQFRAGSPGLFGSGSKLGAILKEQLERLNQVLTYNPNVIRDLNFGVDHK